MARYFLDSSALVKRYHQESGTSVVEGLFSSQEHRFFISRLALVEVHSAFARLVRDRLLREGDLGKLVARLQDDVAAGTPKCRGREQPATCRGIFAPLHARPNEHYAGARRYSFSDRPGLAQPQPDCRV